LLAFFTVRRLALAGNCLLMEATAAHENAALRETAVGCPGLAQKATNRQN
jgi:hypothetical protein